MGIIYWAGTTSDQLDLAANWVGGVAPTGTDDVVVPETAARGMGSNMSGLSDTTGSWYIAPGFRWNIGTSGAPLALSIAGGLIDHSGSEIYYQEGATSTPFVTARKTGGFINLDGDAVTNVYAVAGVVQIASSIGNITSLEVGSGATVTIDSVSSNAITTLIQHGGTVNSGMAITTAHLHAGTLHQTLANKAITTLYQHGGTCLYNSTGTLATAKLYAGLLDLTGDSQAKTVTTLWQWPSARVTTIQSDDDPTAVVVTISTHKHMGREIVSA